MIYELAVANYSDSSDDQVNKVVDFVKDVVTKSGGEVLISDDWGRVRFAQLTSEGKEAARFVYFIYQTDDHKANAEIARRLKITESVMKYLNLKLEGTAEEVVKKYRCPYSKTHRGSALDDFEEKGSDLFKDRRKFAKRKSCWFTAKNLKADWKDPQTWNWLVNEFGKISPARISGISRKHQRWATAAIKQARNIGLASHLSGRTAQASTSN